MGNIDLFARPVRLQKGVGDGNEKSAGGVEQGVPRVQHRAEISGIIYRQDS